MATHFLRTSERLKVIKEEGEHRLKIVRLTRLSKRELDLKFGEKISSKILHLQEAGKAMRLDGSGSWTPGDPSAGSDPDGTGSIDDVPTAGDLPNADDYQQETIDFLKGQQNIYRSAIAEIDRYLAGIQRGKVNVTGTTSGPRTVPSNQTSRTPGPARGFTVSRSKRTLSVVAKGKVAS